MGISLYFFVANMNTLTHPFSGLYTDYYALTMAQGYFFTGRAEQKVIFDYFFRANPYKGGYTIFAGTADLLEALNQFRFEKDDLEFLKVHGFRSEFLSFLKSFSFHGSIQAVREGEVVFPFAPLVRVEGTILEGQLVETLLLNILNFESLIATKASRIRKVVGERLFSEFGLRRAQGLAGIHGSRAAVIGGADSTSNVYAAKSFDLLPVGTQAHSWVQSFENELEAFRAYGDLYPENCTLLVDTYDTLRSGIPNAISVAKEMEKKGHRLKAIRLDSGDLAYLSKAARHMLDEVGLDYVRIMASNQLDEYLIRSLNDQDAPIDAFGVGTNLITGKGSAALDGVYKLAMVDGRPTLKISDNITKVNLPGKKQVIRYMNEKNEFYADGILLTNEKDTEHLYHPIFPEKSCAVDGLKSEQLLHPVMEAGKPASISSTREASAYRQERLALLPEEHQRFENPHSYKVGLSGKVLEMRNALLKENGITEVFTT